MNRNGSLSFLDVVKDDKGYQAFSIHTMYYLVRKQEGGRTFELLY
jgi:hypothetical protein